MPWSTALRSRCMSGSDELLQDGAVELDLGAAAPRPRPACPTLAGHVARGARQALGDQRQRRHAHRHDLVVQVLHDGVQPVDALVAAPGGAARARCLPSSRMRAVARMSSPTASRKSSRISVRTRTVRAASRAASGAAPGRGARRPGPAARVERASHGHAGQVGDLAERPLQHRERLGGVEHDARACLPGMRPALQVVHAAARTRPRAPSAGELLHHQEGAHGRHRTGGRRCPPRTSTRPVARARARPAGLAAAGPAPRRRRPLQGRRRAGPAAAGRGRDGAAVRQRAAVSTRRASRAGSALGLDAPRRRRRPWPAARRRRRGGRRRAAASRRGPAPCGRRPPGPRPGGPARRCPPAASSADMPFTLCAWRKRPSMMAPTSRALPGALLELDQVSPRARRGARPPRTTKSERYFLEVQAHGHSPRAGSRRRPAPSSPPRARPRT